MASSKKIIHKSYAPVLEPGSAAVSPNSNPTASPPPLWRRLTYRKHVMWMQYRTYCGNVSMAHRTQTNVKVTVFCRNVYHQHFILVTALYSEAADAVCANQHVLFSMIRACGFLPLTLWYIETFTLSELTFCSFCQLQRVLIIGVYSWIHPQDALKPSTVYCQRWPNTGKPFFAFHEFQSSISYLPTACTDFTPPKIFN